MNFENTINIDGKIISTENIQSNAAIVPITPGATSLADVTINWNLANTHILDMSSMDLTGGGGTAVVNLVRGSSSNVRQRLVIVQNDVAPPNHIALTLVAFDTEALVTGQTVEDAVELENLINVAGQTTVLEFDFHDGVFRVVAVKYLENNTYSSTNIIANNDNYNVSLSKLDDVLNKLKPADAPWLDDIETALSFDASTPAKLGWKVLTSGANAENLTFVDPIIKLSTFNAESAGSTVATVDAIARGTIVNNTFNPTLPDTQSNLAMTLTKKVFNPFSDAFDLSLQLQGANAPVPRGTQQPVSITSASRNAIYNILRCVQPTMATAPTYIDLSCDAIVSSKYVCGIPVLRAGDNLNTTVKFNDISYFNSGDGVYGSSVGKLTSSLIAPVTVAADTFSNMSTFAPHSPNMVVNAPVLSNVFSTNAPVTATNFITEIGTNGSATVLTRPTNPIIVDSITNQALFGIDHTQPLTAVANQDKPLILGGIIQYPKLDYSLTWNGAAPQGGLDYTVISNDRFIEFVVTMNQYSRLKVELNNQTGFTNAAIEANPGYEVSLKRADKPSESYNGNAAYSGVGVVADTAGCVDVADSSKTIKILTFGEVVSTIATIRITLTNTSNHKFGQNITITPML